MKSQIPALKRGRDLAFQPSYIWTAPQYRRGLDGAIDIRCLSTRNGKLLNPNNGSKSEGKPRDKKNDKFADRDFFLSVLGSTATKREAKAYLQRFKPPKSPTPPTKEASGSPPKESQQPQHHGVNLGTFYGTARAVENSPKFVQQVQDQLVVPAVDGPLHVALVKIRAPQLMDDDTLRGVALTLSQLAKLGLTSTVVVDCDTGSSVTERDGDLRELAAKQADRLVAAIDAYGEPGSREINNVIGISEKNNDEFRSVSFAEGAVHVKFRRLLMTPLRRGLIPVIPAIGYTDQTQQASMVSADDVVLALTREFAGFKPVEFSEEDPKDIAARLKALQGEVSLDRLIILDPLGGIPGSDLPNGYHVFLNMEQEFDKVKQDLLATPLNMRDMSSRSTRDNISDLGKSNPISNFVESELRLQFSTSKEFLDSKAKEGESQANSIHVRNLELVRNVLALLPPSSSALLTTPDEAANSGKQSDTSFQGPGVGTRRQRNPLIHNLLTDKPVYSSSLPAGRLGRSDSGAKVKGDLSKALSPTTFAKRGMPVSIFPDPSIRPWEPPTPGKPQLSLTDSLIDLPRLVHLIDDSFDRKLDVQNYLNRVNKRIAGVIIAGAYEGGALLTWETPPGVPDDGSEESRSRMVPYLDKFAVLKRSQGAGGVADVLFKAMVRDCFPDGVCWRSRRDNPVNKWYFERSRGTWKMPGTNWTMFWTTPELDQMEQIFMDYSGVCRSIQPSWADKKAVID